MTKLENALALAARGFYVFPLIPDGKTPAVDGWQAKASRDTARVRAMWTCSVTGWEHDYNIGIYTGQYGDGKALLVIDVDTKNGKDGNVELLRLEMEGKDIPPTLEALTPTGGRHLFYEVDAAVKQGANTLGVGLDTRSRGGYVCGHGSVTDKGEYVLRSQHEIAMAPAWLVAACGTPIDKPRAETAAPAQINTDRATQRALDYLTNHAPVAIEGDAGDQTTFMVAARLKDFGVSENEAVDLLIEYWNDNCQPPWPADELETKVRNAYRYGKEAPGAAAPEADFPPAALPPEMEAGESYLDRLNREYALVYVEGGHFIIYETVDEKGRVRRVFFSEATFKRRFSPYSVTVGKRTMTYADAWLEWKGRREYQGVCFAPERQARNGYYNLWRGFTVQPLPYEQANERQRQGFDMWKEHIRENVCNGEASLYRWLIGYFAHMIQRPWERPLTTLVFRGTKGVGKNAPIDRVGYLLSGEHYLVAHDGRYLTSNFNGHLDACLCLVLDEAFWSGDKAAEGKLKGLTTQPELLIERKGKEPYKVDNLVRLVVIGNEDWLVPATTDERRYAVFDVGDGRKQDRQFFYDMRIMLDEEGGAGVLLDYLKNFDLSDIDVNGAPNTGALLDQKLSSLEVLHQWWHDCLEQGHIIGSDFDDGWPTEMLCDRLRDAYTNYARKRNVRNRIEDYRKFGKELKRCVSIHPSKKRNGEKFVNIYKLPVLEEARSEWDKFIGHEQEWDDRE